MFFVTVSTNLTSGVLSVPCYDMIRFIAAFHRDFSFVTIFLIDHANDLFRVVDVPLIYFLEFWIHHP